jgi:hypothetical protein
VTLWVLSTLEGLSVSVVVVGVVVNVGAANINGDGLVKVAALQLASPE